MTVDLSPAKASVASGLPPGHPGRELLLSLPDRISEREFDALFPSLLRVLKLKEPTNHVGRVL